MFLNSRQINNFIKNLATTSLLLILFCIQVNALPLSMTFGENHEASFIYQNGETFLKLGHNHKHNEHHIKNHIHSHESRKASIFNGHDGIHSDHLIRLSNSDEEIFAQTNNFIKTFKTIFYKLVKDTKEYTSTQITVNYTFMTDLVHLNKEDLITKKYFIQYLA